MVSLSTNSLICNQHHQRVHRHNHFLISLTHSLTHSLTVITRTYLFAIDDSSVFIDTLIFSSLASAANVNVSQAMSRKAAVGTNTFHTNQFERRFAITITNNVEYAFPDVSSSGSEKRGNIK